MKPKFPESVDFNTYIENQRAFEKHKKKLGTIYDKLNPRSSVEFGIHKNYSFKLLEDKLRNTSYLKEFYQNQEKKFINKDNLIISRKLFEIENRKNIKFNIHELHNTRSADIKKRLIILKNIELNKIKKENCFFGKRLEVRSIPTIKIKKIEKDFENHNNYRRNFNRFQLPEVIEKVPIILKKKLDTSPFKRIQKINNLDFTNFNINVPNKLKEKMGMKTSNYIYDKKISTVEKEYESENDEKFNEINKEIIELEKKYGVEN